MLLLESRLNKLRNNMLRPITGHHQVSSWKAIL